MKAKLEHELRIGPCELLVRRAYRFTGTRIFRRRTADGRIFGDTANATIVKSEEEMERSGRDGVNRIPDFLSGVQMFLCRSRRLEDELYQLRS